MVGAGDSIWVLVVAAGCWRVLVLQLGAGGCWWVLVLPRVLGLRPEPGIARQYNACVIICLLA